jgi:hypothetical protein
MYIICVCDTVLPGYSFPPSLTKGKRYYTKTFGKTYYFTIDDGGVERMYPRAYFITLEESRDKKLGELL